MLLVDESRYILREEYCACPVFVFEFDVASNCIPSWLTEEITSDMRLVVAPSLA
jgi:hypothetical protein